MTDVSITVLVLVVAVAAFVWNRLPVEIVALGVALSLFGTCVISLEDAFSGFGSGTVVLIAALTGASLMALGQLTAALFGNNQPLVDRVREAAAHTGELVWQLPLEPQYRQQLDSDITDTSNLGGKYAGATTAALFLAEFVGDTPGAHLDIPGTMLSDTDDVWRSKGATGFGTRILIELAHGFTQVGAASAGAATK